MDITMGNFFSGSGTWELAAKICGIQVVFESEIEKFPVELEAKRFPEAIQLGDISKVNGKEIPPVDILTNSSPCFTGDSLVRTIDGLKPISDIMQGDYVLTHERIFRKVLNSGCTGHQSVLRLSAAGIDEIIATPNHPFYVRSCQKRYPTIQMETKKYRPRIRLLDDPEWKPLSEVTTDDYIGIPMYDGRMSQSEYSDEILWLLGRYTADGYLADNQQTVCYPIAKEHAEEFRSHIGNEIDGEWSGNGFYIQNRDLWILCSECDKSGFSTNLHPMVNTLNRRQLGILFEGLISSDAVTKNNGTYIATTLNRKLAFDIVYIVGRLFETPATVTTEEFEASAAEKIMYSVVFRKERSKKDKGFYENGYIWLPVQEIEEYGEADVYNLSVDGDESYTVQNIAVHNCQDLSVAGKRAGLDGARSGLFGEVIRITKEMREHDSSTRSDEHIRPWIRPRFWCWENVPGAFSSNGGEDFRRVIEEVARIIEPTATIPKPTKWGGCRSGGR